MNPADKDLPQLILQAHVDDLRDIVSGWIKDHADFEKYVENILCPSIEDVDFSRTLSQAVARETQLWSTRYNQELTTSWDNIYYTVIRPWAENADKLSTERLLDLIDAIVTEVCIRIKGDEIYEDDWYSDDYSVSTQEIVIALEDLAGLILIRKDLTDKTLESLHDLIETAQENRDIDFEIESAFDFLLELIELRRDCGEVTCGLFDIMIEKGYSGHAGNWICRKIDFIREMGLTEEAQKYMADEIHNPQVCLKYYNELMAAGEWQEAIKLLDQAQDLNERVPNIFAFDSPNWLELKQQILDEHCTLEDRIENLKHLFYKSHDKAQYYDRLKELIDKKDWRAFYHDLFSKISGLPRLSTLAPFLIVEREFDWLYNLIVEAVRRDLTDYRTPLKYAAILRSTHFDEIQGILVRTIRAYAADRFPPKKKVKSSKYGYFKADLASLRDAGYGEIQKEIVENLIHEYRYRPSLVSHLREIQLNPIT